MVDFIVFDLNPWYSNIYSCFNTCFPTESYKNNDPILVVFEEPDNILINNDIQIYEDDWYINWSESDIV